MHATLEKQQQPNDVDPEGGDSCRKEPRPSSWEAGAWQCPPHVLAVAQKNAETGLVLIFRDAATKVLWSPAFLALFFHTTGTGYHHLIGRTQFVLGSSELVSKMVERLGLDPHWTIRLAALVGLCGTLVSLRFLLVDGFASPGWFGTLSIANGLWGVQWGMTHTSLSSIGVDSWAVMVPPSVAAQESYLPNLSQRWNHTAVWGRVFGTLLAGGVVVGLGTTRWGSWENCLVLVVGAATNLACVLPLVGLRSIRSVDAHVYAKCQRALHQELELQRQRQSQLQAQPPQDTAEEATTETETVTANTTATRAVVWIHLSSTLSALADGISAWYLPVVLVEQTDISPLSFQCLSLILLAKDHYLVPMVQPELIRRLGRYQTCLWLPLVSAWLVGAMAFLCGQEAKQHEWWKWQALVHLYLWQVDSTGLVPQILPDALPGKVQLVAPEIQFRLRMVFALGGLLGRHLAGSSSQYGLRANLYVTAVLKSLACLSLLALCCDKKDPAWTREEDDDETNGKPTSSSHKNTNKKDIPPPVPKSSLLFLLRKTLPHCLVAGLIFILYQRESSCSFFVRNRCWCSRWRAH